MSDRDTQIDSAIADYYRQLESGTIPDRASFLNQHRDIRGELESFLHNKTIFDRLAGTPSVSSEAATIAPSTAADESLGSLRYFGDYELLEEIARGGMGVVFKARQVSLNRIVALKMILAGQFAKPEDVQRFRAEAEAAAALDHPNILPVYEVGSLQGQQYFAMKLVEGGTLAGIRESGSGIGDKSKIQILIQVARAVHFAHQRGILHRDLKPGNILLSTFENEDSNRQRQAIDIRSPMHRSPIPYVTDFGLAKKVEGDSGLTQTGAIVGTPSYMAPEQARADKQLSTAVDVYSLGAMLYEVLTGRPPFRAPTVMETVLQVLDKEPEHPTQANKDADRDLSVIALKCLEKDPARRYQSAAELADELDRWSRGEPILARKTGPIARVKKWAKRRPAIAGLLMSLTATLIGGSIGLWASFNQTRTALKTAEQQLYVSRVTLADRELNDGNFERAAAMLESAPKHSRGWEWYYLERKCFRERTRLGNPSGTLEGLASSIDGTIFAVAGNWSNHVAEVYSGDPPQVVTKLIRGKSGYPKAICASGDGNRFAVCFTDGVAVWDSKGTMLSQPFKGQAYFAALNHDGSRLAVVDHSHIVHLLSIPDGRQLATVKGNSSFLAVVCFHPERNEIASTTGTDVIIWNSETGAEIRKLDLTFSNEHVLPAFPSVQYSADGSWLFVGGYDCVIPFKTANWQRQKVLHVPNDPRDMFNQSHQTHSVSRMAISANGKVLVTSSNNDTVPRVFDLENKTFLHRLDGHFNCATGVMLSADGGTAITASHDSLIRIWDVPLKPNPKILLDRTSSPSDLCYSPNGELLAVGHADGDVRLIRRLDALVLQTWRIADEKIIRLAFSADGQLLAAGSCKSHPTDRSNQAHGVLKVWQVADGKELMSWSPPRFGISDLAFAPTGEALLVCHGESRLEEFDARNGSIIRTLEVPKTDLRPGSLAAIWTACYQPNGTTVMAGGLLESAMCSWNLRNGEFASGYQDPDQSYRPAARIIRYSMDGQNIYQLTSGTCRIWDGRSRKLIREIEKVSSDQMTVSPDGRRVVAITRRVGTVGSVVGVWDIDSGERVLRLPNADANAVAFHPDGHRIAISDGSRVFEYDAKPKYSTHHLVIEPSWIWRISGYALALALLLALATGIYSFVLYRLPQIIKALQ